MSDEKHVAGSVFTGAPVFKARGRTLVPHITTESRDRARQTDSAAYTVELLDAMLAETRRANALAEHTNALLVWLGETIQNAAQR